jgi:hypothetical protein
VVATVLRGLIPYGLLAGLALVFFAELAIHPGHILYSPHSDFIVQYLPAKRFLVGSWRADGELPLWCPYAFAGMPFIHDIQVAAFYPPQAFLYLLPEALIGPAMSWLIVIHVVIAGWGAYAYARSRGLGMGGSLVTGLGYMFAGKWLLHLLGGGHHTFAPIAWLPVVLLLMNAALVRAGRGQIVAALLCATWGGAVFGVLCLGTQPQLTFYAGLFLAVWLLGPAFQGTRTRAERAAALGRWAGLGAWAAAWAIGVFAVQLLPSAEAAKETTRAVTGAVPDPPGTVVRALLSIVGPSLEGEGWDYQGGFGLLWIVAAALAPILAPERARFPAVVTLVLVLFALGGPFLEELPVFRLFRVPARMFLIAALPISLLAGMTTDALFSAKPLAPALVARCRRVALGLTGLLLLGVATQAGLLWLAGRTLHLQAYWLALLLLVPAALWLPARLPVASAWRVAWVAVLLLDLWFLALPLVEVRSEAEIYAPTQCVRYLAEHEAEHGRVLDRDVPGQLGDTPLGFAQPLLLRIAAVRGLNPIDVYRYKKYIQFISDQDEPLTASGGVVNFEIRNRPLLDLLGTRYLLQPSALKLEGQGWQEVEIDPRPVAFGLILGGMRSLPPYTIYENREAFPRAFLVSTAAPLPEGAHVLFALKETDLRRTVLLEGAPAPANPGSSDGTAVIRGYRPNRVTIDVEGRAGFLVLTDVWFPGWTCTVDGHPTEVYRADYVFRAVQVPEGAHEVVFRFEPASYHLGLQVSAVTVALLAVLSLAAGVWLIRE